MTKENLDPIKAAEQLKKILKGRLIHPSTSQDKSKNLKEANQRDKKVEEDLKNKSEDTDDGYIDPENDDLL